MRPLIQIQRTTAQSSFDHGVPSILPSKHLLRTQAIIETLLGSEKIRRSSDFSALFSKPVITSWAQFASGCIYECERRDVPVALAASVFPDHLQILPQLDPAAVWQKAAKIYTRVNHAIAADNRAGIDDRIAAYLGSVTDDCAEFS